MTFTSPSVSVRRTVRGLRWWIAAVLFASTIINYVDRQTLSLLAPYLKVQYRWSNADYANIVIAFRVAYSIGQTVFGRLMDRIGTRRGLTLTVMWYSLISILTPLARGFYSFGLFRFLLGAGESANWPAASKAVSEWFPKQERGLATAFFDSGSSVGAAIAPFVVLSIYFRWGWRPAVAIPGMLGFLWLILWRRIYQPPEHHALISDAERNLIAADKRDAISVGAPTLSWRDLLKFPQTWGAIVSRAFTDPVWFFVTDWFPIYLVAKGIDLRSGFVVVWVPFIAADLGNFFGGWTSGWLIKRGWSLGAARKAIAIFGGTGMMLLIPTILTYESSSVGSVSGMSGTAAGIVTIIAVKLIGHYSDLRQGTATHVFDPIMIVAGLIPFCGMILVLLLVRNTKATRQGLVREI